MPDTKDDSTTPAPQLTPETVIARSDEVLEAELDGEVVMMSIDKGEYYGLDEVGTSIWQLLETPRSVSELCTALVAEYEVEEERCQQDVMTFLDQLIRDGTVETRAAEIP